MTYLFDIEKVVSVVLEDTIDDPNNYFVKVCMDGGMNLMKIGVQILYNKDQKQRPPILVAAVDCKETTGNITRILDHCGLMKALANLQSLHNFKIIFAGDSKVLFYN